MLSHSPQMDRPTSVRSGSLHASCSRMHARPRARQWVNRCPGALLSSVDSHRKRSTMLIHEPAACLLLAPLATCLLLAPLAACLLLAPLAASPATLASLATSPAAARFARRFTCGCSLRSRAHLLVLLTASLALPASPAPHFCTGARSLSVSESLSM